jgi:L-aminopeptidase/D-esterase-like protein
VTAGVTSIHPRGPGGTGDPVAPAFTPAQLRRLDFLPWESLDPLFEAVVQATEEAVVNALVANVDMTGRDGPRRRALPRDRSSRCSRRQAGSARATY